VNRIEPQGAYRPAVLHGSTVVSAGMTPRGPDGNLLSQQHVGGDGLSVAAAAELAHAACGRAVEACRQALPPGARLVEALVLTVYLRTGPDFDAHSRVADGASLAIREQLGGDEPARAVVGVFSLPGRAPLELQLTCSWTPSARAGRRRTVAAARSSRSG